MKKQLRLGIALVLTLLTVAAFAYYLSKHHNLLTQLRHTSSITVIILVLLYLAWFGSLLLIQTASLRLCSTSLPVKENFLLNSYSTLVNFFVPGQGGLIVRGAYLKQHNRLRVRLYVFVTLLYYLCYAMTSALLLLVSSRPWWQTLLGVCLVAGVSISVLQWYAKRDKAHATTLDLRFANCSFLLLATILQAVLQVAIYFVEIHSVHHHVSLGQAMAYTGAANFALFVALTPAAIGIRESFLLFTEKLNHLTSGTIVAASLIDRAVFIVFLALLFIVVISFHAKDKLHIKSLHTAAEPADD
jgi:uncharacterized membrane protein YbhN (UPF0104 family)